MRTPLRSYLFIPGDSDKKLAKGAEIGADALVLDLEDAVAPAQKADARKRVADFIGARDRTSRQKIIVRINPLASGLALDDLAAVMPAAPDGVMLPKADGPADAQRLSYYLDAFEAAARISAGACEIIPVATETAIAPFRLADYAGAGLTRLAGLTWGAEDLSAALGASTNRDEDGGFALVYRMARALTLLAAHAAGVAAIDTLYADFRDEAGLAAASRAARAEGFTGRLAIHPAQVKAINDGFTPSDADIAAARRIVEAFAAAPGAGAIGLDGRMLDLPHLKQAERTLAQAAAFSA
jgi:citrate lyase subunit beta/citryl-CoA lyase